MEIKIDKIIRIVAIIVLVANIILIGISIKKDWEKKTVARLIKTGDYRIDCYNLSIEDTADCLAYYVRGWYNYTHRTDIERDIDDIIKNGGDCFDYSGLYVKMAEDIGFNGERIVYPKENPRHAFALIYNENKDYCIIDNQWVFGCQRLMFPNQTINSGDHYNLTYNHEILQEDEGVILYFTQKKIELIQWP